MIKYIEKMWVAKDIEHTEEGARLSEFETNAYSKKPKLDKKGVWQGEQISGNEMVMIDLPDLKFERGECKRVKITIEEIK